MAVSLQAAEDNFIIIFFPTLVTVPVVGKGVACRNGIISQTESSSVMQEKHRDDGAHKII